MDDFAKFLGYAIIYTGAILLVISAVVLSCWAAIEVWWRRFGNFRVLREFMQWKNARFPG